MKYQEIDVRTGGACCHHPEPVEVHLHPTNQPLLKLEGIGMHRDDRIILEGVNETVNQGDFVAITGPNGGGKTTLLRIILGLLKPSEGRVVYPSAKPTIGYLPQKNMIDSQFPISVREVVASGLLGFGKMPKDEVERRVSHTISQIEMDELAERPIGRLSGGQLQRALLGRAIIADPKLLVLDEPLSYIDKHFENHIYRLLGEIAPHSTVMLVSHEMSQISTMANRHWIIDRTLTECTATHHFYSDCC